MHVSNQEQQGGTRGDGANAAPETSSDDVAAQLAKEREAKALMRERLRNTEALAAESHALRARMAQELERVTAERDRLRTEAATAAAVAEAIGSTPDAAPQVAAARPDGPPIGAARPAEPTLSPAPSAASAAKRPLPPRPPEWSANRPPAKRRGPWRALGLLAGLAACAAGIAWITGAMPEGGTSAVAGASAAGPVPAPSAVVATVPVDGAAASASSVVDRNANASDALDRAASAVAASRRETLAAATPTPTATAATTASSPEATLAAAPTAAGPAASAPGADMPARLRAALDAEGVLAPVEIDARSGRIAVSDPAADNATRDRTDMLIRAAYAGANLPEPQIEHRWVSPPRAGRGASAAVETAPPATPAAVAAAHAHAKRETAAPAPAVAAVDHRRHGAAELVAAAEEPRVILPMGRITAGCKASVATTSPQRRAGEMSTCMRHSCCSGANRQTEECRAFVRSYPSTCTAG